MELCPTYSIALNISAPTLNVFLLGKYLQSTQLSEIHFQMDQNCYMKKSFHLQASPHLHKYKTKMNALNIVFSAI
jgi:hypothetical protein